MMIKRKQRRFLLLTQVLLLYLAILTTVVAKEEAAASSFGRYHALVIGNQDYKYLQDLKTPLSDAREIARILKEKYGFKVTLLLDKNREETVRALGKLRGTISKEDNLLIYYAGHGYLDTVTDVGYWQPIDAERDIDVNWIPSTYLTALFKGLQANHILVIADSCFSGNLLTRDSGTALNYGRDVWLQRMRDRKSRTAFTSGGQEPVIDGGGGNHSIFAKALINTLRDNNKILTGQSLFDLVSHLVVANAAQTPRYGAIRMTEHEFGDFLFVPKGFTELPPGGYGGSIPGLRALRGSPEPIDQDRHDWELLAKLGEDGLKSYRTKHPNGKWAAEAGARIEKLERRRLRSSATSIHVQPKLPVASQQENNKQLTSQDQAQALFEWQTNFIYSNNSRAIEQFLQMYPTGSHVPDAKRKLADLRAQGL